MDRSSTPQDKALVSADMWQKILWNARYRDISFDITRDSVEDLFIAQDGRCALSGVALTFDLKAETGRTASLDRRDSSLGYIAGNVQWVHKDINRMKLAYTEDYFVEMCARIAAHRRPYGNDNEREALAGRGQLRAA